MDHYIEIYSRRAAEYHHMIASEDIDGNLLPALEQVISLKGKRVLDLGTGTGRLPLLFGHQTAQMASLDLHGDMLREHKLQWRQRSGSWGPIQGDMRALPVPTGWAEVVTAGWAIGHLIGWYAANWQTQVGTVLGEMHRLADPGGALIIIETLSTGSLKPAPPNKELARYYAWLENEWGFSRQEIRTDYQFDSIEDAADRTEFFFGSELASTIREQGWARVPEWTGIWGKRV